MSVCKQRRVRKFPVLFCIITFTTSLVCYIFWDPSIFFKHTLRLADHYIPKVCACQQCIRDLEDDPWFAEHFNQSLHPLMTSENSVLSDETYKWWMSLQQEKHPANYRKVIEELFQVIPDEVRYQDAGPNRCRTCSVVGNSGILKGSMYGKLIDTSDFVIRMNQAPTRGYEEDVGTRTTHHVLYPESAIDLDNNTSLVFVPFKIVDLQWITSALTTGTIRFTLYPVRARIKTDKNKVLIYSPTFLKYITDSWLEGGRGQYSSTGFLSLVLALHICDEVKVFGFGANAQGNWHHYWENNGLAGDFRQTWIHDGEHEYNVTVLLAEKHKIQLFI